MILGYVYAEMLTISILCITLRQRIKNKIILQVFLGDEADYV